MPRFLFLFGLLITFGGYIYAQTSQQAQKAQMRYVATFDAGQPGAGIYKLYDQSDDVICYVLMPETASRKQVDGKWVYESNAVGSISCLKSKVVIAPQIKQIKP